MLTVAAILVVIAATIAALVECAQTPAPRLLPRWTWLIVILVLPVIGPVAWFLAGRERRKPRSAPFAAPDDDPRFLRQLGDEDWSRRQRERRKRKPPDQGNLPGPHPA